MGVGKEAFTTEDTEEALRLEYLSLRPPCVLCVEFSIHATLNTMQRVSLNHLRFSISTGSTLSASSKPKTRE